MKYKVLFSFASLLLFLMACKKDNFDPPKSSLSGRVVYQNLPVGVRSNGVQLELWQPGYAFFNKIPIYVAQDGTFSASLFDGEYKLTRLKGNGPWADNTDTIAVSVRGNAVVDVPVDPYYVVKSQTFTRTAANVTASITLQRGNTSKALEAVRLYIGQTLIVDQTLNNATSEKATAAIPDATQPITITVTIPASLMGKDFVYARVGVKTAGVAELAYSIPEKITLK